MCDDLVRRKKHCVFGCDLLCDAPEPVSSSDGISGAKKRRKNPNDQSLKNKKMKVI
jgi:hypothetical protein